MKNAPFLGYRLLLLWFFKWNTLYIHEKQVKSMANTCKVIVGNSPNPNMISQERMPFLQTCTSSIPIFLNISFWYLEQLLLYTTHQKYFYTYFWPQLHISIGHANIFQGATFNITRTKYYSCCWKKVGEKVFTLWKK